MTLPELRAWSYAHKKMMKVISYMPESRTVSVYWDNGKTGKDLIEIDTILVVPEDGMLMMSTGIRDDRKSKKYPKGKMMFKYDVVQWNNVGSYKREPSFGIVVYIEETGQFGLHNAYQQLGNEDAYIEPFCDCGGSFDETQCPTSVRTNFKVIGHIYSGPGRAAINRCLEQAKRNKEKRERQIKYTPKNCRGGRPPKKKKGRK